MFKVPGPRKLNPRLPTPEAVFHADTFGGNGYYNYAKKSFSSGTLTNTPRKQITPFGNGLAPLQNNTSVQLLPAVFNTVDLDNAGTSVTAFFSVYVVSAGTHAGNSFRVSSSYGSLGYRCSAFVNNLGIHVMTPGTVTTTIESAPACEGKLYNIALCTKDTETRVYVNGVLFYTASHPSLSWSLFTASTLFSIYGLSGSGIEGVAYVLQGGLWLNTYDSFAKELTKDPDILWDQPQYIPMVFEATGFVSVTKDSTFNYKVRTQLSKDISAIYSVRGSVTSDISSDYVVRQSVLSDSNFAYIVRQGVSSDLNSEYKIRTSVSSDNESNYVIRTAVVSDLTQTYNVRESITSDGNFEYKIRSSVSSDLTTEYNVRTSVVSSIQIVYNVLSSTEVIKDLSFNYKIRSSVTSDSTTEYSILQSVQKDKEIVYLVRTSVQKDQNIEFLIRKNVEKDLVSDYKIRSAVISDVLSEYKVRTSVQSDLQTVYVVRTTVEVSKDLNFLYSIFNDVPSDAVVVYVDQVKTNEVRVSDVVTTIIGLNNDNTFVILK